MTRQKIKTTIVTIIGALGYMFCMLQWLWAITLLLPLILNSDFVKQFTATPAAPVQVASQPAEMSIVGIVFLIAVVVAMTILTIYMLIKIPYTIGKTGSKITHIATEFTVPVITNHKKISKKTRLQLTARVLFSVKIAMCVVPYTILLLTNNDSVELSRDLILVVGGLSAVGAMGLFCLQAAGAKLLHVDYRQTW